MATTYDTRVSVVRILNRNLCANLINKNHMEKLKKYGINSYRLTGRGTVMLNGNQNQLF